MADDFEPGPARSDPPAAAREPAPSMAAPVRSRARWTLGMPQLDACGLSENWLQKTCGDRHWRVLARLVGRPPEAWSDADGQRVYAAFTYLRLSAARLDEVAEGRQLQIDSRVAIAGRAQAHGRHRLQVDGRPVGQLDLLSTFVSRHAPGRNRSVRRVDGLLDEGPASDDTRALLRDARALRALARGDEAPPDLAVPVDVRPCPRHDFNGAGLLYFASFGAWVDRALWHWGPLTAEVRVAGRECSYCGNAELGESLRLRLIGDEVSAGQRRCTVLVVSADDGRPLAVSRLTLTVTPRRTGPRPT